jgi:hypothetical protein
MTTQCEQILQRLKTGRTLTPVDALNDFGCFRLAARVKDLRDSGHDIVTIRESQGEKVFARYLLRSSNY